MNEREKKRERERTGGAKTGRLTRLIDSPVSKALSRGSRNGKSERENRVYIYGEEREIREKHFDFEGEDVRERERERDFREQKERHGVRRLRSDSTNSSFKSAKTYRYVGHSLATYQQYVVYVSEGVIKNCYNQIKGIKDWPERTTRAAKGTTCYRYQKGRRRISFTSRIYTGTSRIRSTGQFIHLRKISSTWLFGNRIIGENFARLVNTPASRRCLNLGSYNYLGFGGVNSFCTPRVMKAAMENPVTSGSCAAELGRTKLLTEVEEYTARYVGKESGDGGRDGVCDEQYRFTRVSK